MAVLVCLVICSCRPKTALGAAPTEYMRAVEVDTNRPATACINVDAELMTHTAGRLHDLRLQRFAEDRPAGDVPLRLTESGEAGQLWERAPVQHIAHTAARDGSSELRFELRMPKRPYTEIRLALGGRGFRGLAQVWGVTAAGKAVGLGAYPIFALDEPGGEARDTTLRLQEAAFPVLRVQLRTTPERGTALGSEPPAILSAEVPPSREAQALLTPVATGRFIPEVSADTAALTLPAHVPVTWLSISVPGSAGQPFARTVTLEARQLRQSNSRQLGAAETLRGLIYRVRLALPGRLPQLAERLGFEAVLGANLQAPAEVRVSVPRINGKPLSLGAVTLSMRQRQLCFGAEPASSYRLFYGDAEDTPAPVAVDPSTLAAVHREVPVSVAEGAPLQARVGAEVALPRPEEEPREPRQPRRGGWLLLMTAAVALLLWRGSRLWRKGRG